MDTVPPAVRSRMMAAIRGRDTRPERLVRHHLWHAGWRYRVCDRRLPGHPDIVIPRARAIIEVRGCFWHRHGWTWDGRKLVHETECPAATTPKTNRPFWNAKFRTNVRRDARNEQLWHDAGWNVVVLWTCALDATRLPSTLRWLDRTLARWTRPERRG